MAFEKGLNSVFIAPEVQDAKRTSQVGPASDVWSLGVILYLLHSGGNRRLGAESLNFKEDCWSFCPIHLLNLVQSCLHETPAERPTVLSLLNSVFIRERDLAKDLLGTFQWSSSGVLEQYHLSALLDTLVCRQVEFYRAEADRLISARRAIEQSKQDTPPKGAKSHSQAEGDSASAEFKREFGEFQSEMFMQIHSRSQKQSQFNSEARKWQQEEWLDQVDDQLNQFTQHQGRQIERSLLLGVLKLNKSLINDKKRGDLKDVVTFYTNFIHEVSQAENLFVGVEEIKAIFANLG